MEQQSPLERGFFREAEDGSPVFFPWGVARRGYRLPDARAKRRAQRAVSLLFFAVTAIAAWTAQALQPVLDQGAPSLDRILGELAAPAMVLGVVLAGYALWAHRVVERYPVSVPPVPQDERFREAARLVPPWKILVIGLVLAGLSGVLWWLRPQLWWLTGLGVALGVGLVVWGRIVAHVAARATREPIR